MSYPQALPPPPPPPPQTPEPMCAYCHPTLTATPNVDGKGYPCCEACYAKAAHVRPSGPAFLWRTAA